MNTILTVIATILIWTIAATAILVVIGRATARKNHDIPYTAIKNGDIAEPETASDTSLSDLLGGTWEYQCPCNGCQTAPQPKTFVCPSPRSYGHHIPRDQYCHARNGDCLCQPDTEFTIAGPIYLHNTVQKEPAA